MKNRISFIFAALVLGLTSCGGSGVSDFAENAESILALEKNLKAEFGDDAYYTSINIMSSDLGSVVNLTNTKDPSSLNMEEWNYLSGTWTQISDVTLELSGGSAEEFMFKIGDLVKFDVLGKIVEDAKEILKNEKDIDAKVSTILINAPSDGDFDSMIYFLDLEPTSGGTSFDFQYTLSGELIKYDY